MEYNKLKNYVEQEFNIGDKQTTFVFKNVDESKLSIIRGLVPGVSWKNYSQEVLKEAYGLHLTSESSKSWPNVLKYYQDVVKLSPEDFLEVMIHRHNIVEFCIHEDDKI